MPTTRFPDRFRLLNALTLEQPDSEPIVRLSGLDRSDEGSFLLADVSESNVKLFDSAGALKVVLGRHGGGPGEFSRPRFPRFGPDGRIYVADSRPAMVSVFDKSGAFVRRTTIAQLSLLSGFEVLPDLGFLVAGFGPDSGVLYRTDSTGTVSDPLIFAGDLADRDLPPSPAWAAVTLYPVGFDARRAHIISTIGDALWRIDLATGERRTEFVDVPARIAPSLPERSSAGPQALQSWSRSFHQAVYVHADDDLILIPFVQGVLTAGDPAVLMVRHPSGAWEALVDAPPGASRAAGAGNRTSDT